MHIPNGFCAPPIELTGAVLAAAPLALTAPAAARQAQAAGPLAAAGLCGTKLWLSGQPTATIPVMIAAHLPVAGIEMASTLLVAAAMPRSRPASIPLPVRP